MTMPKGHDTKRLEREEGHKFKLMRKADDLEVTILRVEQAIKTGDIKVLIPATGEIREAIKVMRED